MTKYEERATKKCEEAKLKRLELEAKRKQPDYIPKIRAARGSKIKEPSPIDLQKERILEAKRKYYNANKEVLAAKKKEIYYKKKLNNDLTTIKQNIRRAINSSILKLVKKNKEFKRLSKVEIILGCSFQEFKAHLESQFEPWMNWDNKGLYNGQPNFGWDIDHVIPSNTAKNEFDVIKLNHYTNLKPLCSYYNRHIKK